MRVLISGASGYIGSALSRSLSKDGHEVIPLVRKSPRDGEVAWQPDKGTIESEKLEGIDAAVNLSGESIFGRWNADKKRRILESRTTSTRTLATALAAMNSKPAVLVSMSGANYYGDRGEEELSEASGRGEGFLAEVCERWEAETQPARDAGIRVVNTRMGLVVGPGGGSLETMLPIFKLGLGGKLGNGTQFMSWVSLDDAIAAIRFALTNSEATGAVNLAPPNPVRNADFTKALASALRRPAFLTVPAFALRIALAEAADDLLLSSVRVSHTNFEDWGFRYKHPEIKSALENALSGDK